MKKGGIGGLSTLTGYAFERDTDLRAAILNSGKYQIDFHSHSPLKGSKIYNVTDKRTGEVVGVICGKAALYGYLKKEYPDIDFKSRVSKHYLPDECFINFVTKTIYIIEKKMQTVAGSVDEKIRGSNFLVFVYSRLLFGLGFEVDVAYLLSDWFRDPQYKDWMDYAEFTKTKVYFEKMPLEHFGL